MLAPRTGFESPQKGRKYHFRSASTLAYIPDLAKGFGVLLHCRLIDTIDYNH